MVVESLRLIVQLRYFFFFGTEYYCDRIETDSSDSNFMTIQTDNPIPRKSKDFVTCLLAESSAIVKVPGEVSFVGGRVLVLLVFGNEIVQV